MHSKVDEVRKFPPKISILVHPKQISVVSKQKVTRERERKKVICSFPYRSISHFKFSSSPFTTSLLFPLHFPFFPSLSIFPFFVASVSLSYSFSLSLPFFPLPSLFPHFPPSFQNFSPNFPRWATRPPYPPLVTPLLILCQSVNDIDQWFAPYMWQLKPEAHVLRVLFHSFPMASQTLITCK